MFNAAMVLGKETTKLEGSFTAASATPTEKTDQLKTDKRTVISIHLKSKQSVYEDHGLIIY